MNDCKTIKEVTEEVIKSGNAEIIPYDIGDLSVECRKELYLLYIKYGKDEGRKEVCKKGYSLL